MELQRAAGQFVPGWGRYKNSPGWIVTDSGCHIWTGARGGNGYAIAVARGVHTTAYRVRYEREIGPIPAGMDLDHFVCNNGAGGCCNPLHCRPVTPRENTLRSNSNGALNAAKTHCAEGHPLSGDNLVGAQLKVGRRLCRTCRNAKRWIDVSLHKRPGRPRRAVA